MDDCSSKLRAPSRLPLLYHPGRRLKVIVGLTFNVVRGKGTNPAKVFSGLSWSRSSRSLTKDSVDFSEQCRLGAHCVTLKKLCDEEQNLYKAVKIDIWFQPWIPWLTYFEFRDLMESIREKAPGLRSVADLLFRRTRHWNSEHLCFLFGDELGIKISTIQIATDLNEDLLIWKQANNGNFSVKEAYLLHQGGRFGSIDPLWKWIWHGELHPRMRMTLWRALSGALPLGGKAGLPFNNCCFCSHYDENTLHLFVKCTLASGLWFGSPVPLCTNVVHTESLKTFVLEMGLNLECAQRTRFLLCMAVIIDTIWSKRNALWPNSDEKDTNVKELLDSVRRRFWEFSQNSDRGDLDHTVSATPLLQGKAFYLGF
uniref:Reverse transcriptase zinc-binding domain-containing protein n=1 Tax=Cannabis sativa TaxID=3483 RepID=A0A803PV24_CANSA